MKLEDIMPFKVRITDGESTEEVELATVKRGEWINEKLYDRETLEQIAWKHKCSGCGFYINTTDEQIGWRYCPHCGAQMMETEE